MAKIDIYKFWAFCLTLAKLKDVLQICIVNLKINRVFIMIKKITKIDPLFIVTNFQEEK